jgi:hypothetical protein
MARKYDMAVQDIIDLYQHSNEAWGESRTASMLCYNFVMNKQWTDAEIAAFLKEKRPPMVYNLILPRLNNLVGSEQQNRRSARIRPASGQMAELASTLDGLHNNIWETNEAEFELEKVFLDGLINLVPGWLRIDVKPNDLGFLEYEHRSTNPFSIFPDPDYRDYKLRDCNWIVAEQWMTMDEIADSFGNKKEFKDEKQPWFEKIKSRLGGLFGAGDLSSPFVNMDGNKYKVLELQERYTEQTEIFANLESGEYTAYSKKEAEEIKDNTNYAYITNGTRQRIRIKTVIPHFDIMVVNEPYFIKTGLYNLIPYCSFDLNNLKSKSNSLVNAIMDPQRNLNKREIQKTSYIDHAINSPIMFYYEDYDAKKTFEEEGNKPGSTIMYRNTVAPPKRMQPANVNSDVWNDIADSRDKMNDISGINDTARGQSEYSNESARLFSMKAERTGATINPYFRNLSKSRKMAVEYFLETVSQVYSEPNRAVEISDRAHVTQEVVLNNLFDGSNMVEKFEGRVILDEGEYSSTKLQENMQTKLVLAQSMPPELVNWAWILKDSDLPDINEQIEYISMMMGIQQDQTAMQTAMQEDQAITQQLLAEKQLKEEPKQEAKAKGKK